MATTTKARRNTLTGMPEFEDTPSLRERLDPPEFEGHTPSKGDTPLKEGTPEFDAYVTEGAPAAPDGSAERVADLTNEDENASKSAFVKQEPETQADGTITVTDYDANGEAIDAPVEPASPTPELFTALRPPEMWDGKEVVAHVLKFAGNCPVGRAADEDVDFWGAMRADRKVYLRISAIPQGTSYDAAKRDGDIVGFNMVRKLRVDSWSLSEEADELAETALALEDATAERDHYGQEYGRAVQALNTLADSIDALLAENETDDPKLLELSQLATDMVAEFEADMPAWAGQGAPEDPEEQPSPLAQALAQAIDPDDLPFD